MKSEVGVLTNAHPRTLHGKDQKIADGLDALFEEAQPTGSVP